MFDLTGRVAVVSGGNGGIGLAMARGLLQAGARVVIWGSKADKTEAARQALVNETAGEVHALVCDVGDEAQVEAAVARTLERVGRIDGFFANAGVSGFGSPLIDMSLDEFRRVMRVNLEGAFLCFRAAARQMIAQGEGGVLVATASTAALEGAARNSHYGASKGAVTSFVRALAVELARHRIRVNSLIPGWIETDMTAAKFADPRFSANVLPRIPARRWGSADDFAGIAVYLMSEASSYMTGEALVLDGAYTLF
jgi:NAD(P)-dependent dehydrogenase (short-subunit alcohol dehydrogenase family)